MPNLAEKLSTIRPSGRQPNQLRAIKIETNVSEHAEGSCLIHCGKTRVLCTASVEDRIPPWLRNSGQGWVTAEYGMLPRSTGERMNREAARGKQGGRTVEIQRLIGRSLRSVVDLKKLGMRQVVVDCDVLNADGGTRTASITGGYVALHLAMQHLVDQRILSAMPLTGQVAAISCGIFRDLPVLDLDYAEDSNAEADANFVLTDQGGIVEIQGTAEGDPFSEEQFSAMFALAKSGIAELVEHQKEAISAVI